MWARNVRWILPEMPDFHVAFMNLLHAVNLRLGTDGFTSPPKEGVLRIFPPWKIRRLRPGLNPRTWVPKKEGLAVIAFLKLPCLAFEAGMKHTEVHILSYCYSLSGLFHHKSAAVLLITSKTVKPKYTVKPTYNGTARNINIFRSRQATFRTGTWSLDSWDCKRFPLKLIPGSV